VSVSARAPAAWRLPCSLPQVNDAMRRALYLLPLVLFLVLGGFFARSLRPDYDPHVLPSAMIDREAPQFDLAGLKDEGLARDALKGGPVLINFFASWCVPCRVEHPLLMALANREHVPLYGIDYKDQPEDAAKLLAQFGDPYRRVGLDRDGRVGLDFGVYGVPETYVLDSDGHIRKRFVGPLTAEQVDKELLPLLKALRKS
jgi:cytochrome c biogenesis protein CcmG/thiol:disulfide interchange protein DsbE